MVISGTIKEIAKDGSLVIAFDNGKRKTVNPTKTKSILAMP